MDIGPSLLASHLPLQRFGPANEDANDREACSLPNWGVCVDGDGGASAGNDRAGAVTLACGAGVVTTMTDAAITGAAIAVVVVVAALDAMSCCAE